MPEADRSSNVMPLPGHRAVLADGGPDPGRVLELLEVCGVVISHISQPCCWRKSPLQPPTASAPPLLSSGLLILSLFTKAGTLQVCCLCCWPCCLAKGCVRFGRTRCGGGSALLELAACASQAQIQWPPGVIGDNSDGPALKDTFGVSVL